MESQQIHRHLPEEIIIEILSRLSVKTLLRLKCVSKSWRCLIPSKHFVKTHIENSKKNKTLSHHRHMIISPSLKPPGTLKGLYLHSLLIKPETHASRLDFPSNYSKNLRVLGSCNGLICILVNKYNFVLWNPSTRELKELPDFFAGVKHTERGRITRYGFGFDESRGDYKFYAVFYMFSDNSKKIDIGRIYSLKAGSWGGGKLFTGNIQSHDSYDGFNESGMFVKGKLHWISILPPKWKFEIICLCMKSEAFGVVEQPTCLQGSSKFYPKLVVLDGCLGVSCDYYQTRLDIWIWNEYGVEDSWSKLLTISYVSESWKRSTSLTAQLFPYLATLLMLPNGEVLFNYGCVFVIYNPKDNLFRQCSVVDFDPIYDRAVVHSESLVSLSPDDDDYMERYDMIKAKKERLAKP